MTLIELLVALGLIALIFGGAFMSYSAILDTLTNSQLRTGAVSVLNREIELVRNLGYENVGIVGGWPTGILERQKTVKWSGIDFLVVTTARNVDDPFDGTLGGTPNDTAPADYKTVEFEISCLQCAHFVPISMTTTVAPQNLESTAGMGSLFIYTQTGSGAMVPGVTVHVVNDAVTPTIDLTDTTNNVGVLQLVGVPTSSDAYKIWISKPGYSSEQTYEQGAPANPNPIHPYATVREGQIAPVSFYTDQMSSTTIYTSTPSCGAVQNIPFTLTGTRLIGNVPDVVKVATSSQTNELGVKFFENFEWDTYGVSVDAVGFDLISGVPFLPFTVTPGVPSELRLVYAPHAGPAALSLHTRVAGSGDPISNASVTVSRTGYSKSLMTGHAFLEQTSWGAGEFFAQSGGIDTGSVPGEIRLSGPPYATSTTSWLISNTFDTGSAASTTLFSLNWLPLAQPPSTGAGSLSFQIAANNDDATWNFVGPDGTSGSFYTVSGASIPFALSGNRYVRYRAYLTTADEAETPTVDWVGIEYAGVCVPPASVYFGGLAAGTYDVRATAIGYVDATSTIIVANGWQEATLPLSVPE